MKHSKTVGTPDIQLPSAYVAHDEYPGGGSTLISGGRLVTTVGTWKTKIPLLSYCMPKFCQKLTTLKRMDPVIREKII